MELETIRHWRSELRYRVAIDGDRSAVLATAGRSAGYRARGEDK